MVNLSSTLLLVMISATVLVLARPPRQDHAEMKPAQADVNETKDWDLNLEYNRYLQEIVQVLEGDPEFRKKLEDADVDKIRDGSIANELDFVNHNVRNQLDEIKRKELERLRHLAMRQYELSEGIDKKHIKIPNHLEIKNPTFEKEDLIKLIKTTTKDLEEADQKRREDFKKYEMEKKFEQQERLNHIEDEDKRKEEEQRIKEMEEKHKRHEKPHHPMTKDQLEEVWEEQDHMKPEDWDPKTFFVMHDLNGDGFWDEDEIRMLFKKELDKVYDKNASEDDMKERDEEMERMREHVFKESDKNKDRLISFEEFQDETKREEFQDDPGWDTLDMNEDDVFTDEEFKAYEMQRQREIQDMINKGMIPPNYPYYGDIPPGAQPYHLPQGQQRPAGIPGQPAYHPEQAAQYAGQQHQGQQFVQPNQVAGNPQFQAQGHPQQVQGHPQPIQGQPQPIQGQPQPIQGQPQPIQGHPQPIQGRPQPIQGRPQPIQGHPQPIQAHPAQAQGHPQPIQGQGKPGQFNAPPQPVNPQFDSGNNIPMQQQPDQQFRPQPGDLSRKYGAQAQQGPSDTINIQQNNP